MRLTQKIDRESLHQAMRKASKTKNIYDKVSARMKSEVDKIYAKGDQRDLADIALFLRFKPVFDDPKNGKPLDDVEFETECENLILAFANDDREKIYGYLDKWFAFAANYDPPTEINNEADALKHFVYLRAQQGLGVTKMRDYPDYVATHFPDMTSMMKLQRVEQQLMLQSMWNEFLFDDNDVKIDTATINALDENREAQILKNIAGREMLNELRPEVNDRIPMANAIIDAFDLDHPNPEGEASVKKLVITDWIKSMKGKNIAEEVSADDLLNITNCLRGALGATETGYGLMHTYSYCGQIDLDAYKTVFIDGISIFDMLPDPKDVNAAAAKFMDALANQTGVVSIMHVAEINGKFEYKSDILDVRTGENDNPEYETKINALENNEKYRKAVFDAEKANLDNLLIKGRAEYEQKELDKIRTTAQRHQARTPYANGQNDFTISADKQTVAQAFKIIEDGRKPYNLIAEHLLADTYVDKQGNVQQNPVKTELSPTRLNVDTRDFLDLILFVRYAKTLGIGDVDLTDEETLKESVHMIMSFVSQDHGEIKKYLDLMFNFLESYTPPKEINTVEDVFKTVMYMRVQQTTIMKRRENPWYYEERYSNLMDKADFSAFEAEYLQAHEELLQSWVRDTGLNVGAGLDYEELVKRADSNRREKENNPDVYREIESTERKVAQFHGFAYEYLSERRRRLAYADGFGKNYSFKLKLPQSALALSGENPDPDEFEACADALWIGCVSSVYNSTFVDSDALRSYGFDNNASGDAVHLIYIDGKSLYDIAKEANNGVYSDQVAKKSILSALINQSGLVQFARIMKDGEELKMELDTIDLMQKDVDVIPGYVQKMSQYFADPDARYNEIKNNIVKVCNEKKAEVEANKRNKQYVAGEAQQWKDFAPDAGDLFEPSEYDKQLEAQARIKAYMHDQQEQWDNFVNADLDLFEGEEPPVRNQPGQADEADEIDENNKQLGAIKDVDFTTFKNGRYFVAKENPNSAYSVATMGELRELGVYFGGITAKNNDANYIAIDETAGYISLDEEFEKEYDYSNDLAGICGLKLNKDRLDSVIGEFIFQNRSNDHLSVDKTVFEKQFRLLFCDLYTEALNNINRQCCKNDMTISADQMNDTFKYLDKVLNDSARRVGYPQRIVNCGCTPEQVMTMQEDFLNNYVPQNSVEQAMRRLQAGVQGYDFANIDWKKSMGYTCFGNIVTNEQNKLNGNIANTPDNKLKAAQTYTAMLEHSRNRSFWSKVFNVRKYFGEQAAIEAYKNQAMAKFGMEENEFDELCAVHANINVQTSKNGVQANYQAMLRQDQKDLASELSSVQVGGMTERESEQDLENASVLSEDDDVMRTRIFVEEANHKHTDVDEKRKEDVKERKAIEKNELKQNDVDRH